jgi:hypothetical protein
MPPKKGRYITAAACARAGKAVLHRVQTPVSSEPASNEENGPDNSDLPDVDHSSAIPVNDDLDLTDHHHIIANLGRQQKRHSCKCSNSVPRDMHPTAVSLRQLLFYLMYMVR